MPSSTHDQPYPLILLISSNGARPIFKQIYLFYILSFPIFLHIHLNILISTMLILWTCSFLYNSSSDLIGTLHSHNTPRVLFHLIHHALILWFTSCTSLCPYELSIQDIESLFGISWPSSYNPFIFVFTFAKLKLHVLCFTPT